MCGPHLGSEDKYDRDCGAELGPEKPEQVLQVGTSFGGQEQAAKNGIQCRYNHMKKSSNCFLQGNFS